jgi:AraC family transcriptional regulator
MNRMKNSVEIIDISEKKLVGTKIKMSLTNDKTFTLWKNFKSQLSTISNKVNTNSYSIQIYSSDLNFKDFNPNTIFTNCAAVEVSNHFKIPDGMELFIIPKGKYAVFTHKGIAKDAFKTTQYIFEEWLPTSDYLLDSRSHFQIMESDYKPDDPNAKETFWVPVRN